MALYIIAGYVALVWEAGWLGLVLAAAHVAFLFWMAGGGAKK